jgi:hypothetical protein
VSSFELTLTNNTSQQQTDTIAFYDNVPGQRELTLGFQMVFETLAEYNRFHYGGTVGTTQSSSLATVAADFQFDNGANNQVKFTLPNISYEEFPVDPDPSGAPIVVDVRARAQRSASPICTASSRTRSRPDPMPDDDLREELVLLVSEANARRTACKTVEANRREGAIPRRGGRTRKSRRTHV